jgi:hypothetical protein
MKKIIVLLWLLILTVSLILASVASSQGGSSQGVLRTHLQLVYLQMVSLYPKITTLPKKTPLASKGIEQATIEGKPLLVIGLLLLGIILLVGMIWLMDWRRSRVEPVSESSQKD